MAMVSFNFLHIWARGRWRILLLCSLLITVLATFLVYKTQEETRDLVIEELQTGKILWQTTVRQGDKILYENTHSVYKDRVYQSYEVSTDWSLILVKVASSPKVLFSAYPGFGFPQEAGKKSDDLIEANLSKKQDTLVIAVGGALTDNRLTVGKQAVNFTQLVGDGAVVRIYIEEATRS